jgi:hypothetical protein
LFDARLGVVVGRKRMNDLVFDLLFEFGIVLQDQAHDAEQADGDGKKSDQQIKGQHRREVQRPVV